MDLNTSYKTLGIYPGSSAEEIRNAYKSRVKAFHPDLYEHNKNEKQLAEKKLTLINIAYETIRSSIKDHPPSQPMEFKPEQYCQEHYNLRTDTHPKNHHDTERSNKPGNVKIEDRITSIDRAYNLAKIRANERITDRIQQLTQAEAEVEDYLKKVDYKYFESGIYEIQGHKKTGFGKLKQFFLNIQGKTG